ncbi:hypothetical protein SY27_15495 [Flavobacterium sp. 316]|uniref:Natural product n=1 Tax=Flavobacterium sediminilitoris TaxID=2024526 RepID=A0ABY4HPZ1_9FLAO|nr:MULTISPECIES: hypothetical protein [Flavobacterium]KIX19931.1 hypothetical protein SY27_15495 [Flavobacterium sp. 316]UOX33859.1 hypothetical protein LXD69_17720 [Flavobacterium sediminilitoris]
MLNKILSLEGIQKLAKNEQKSIKGSGNIGDSNCRCFCYVGIKRVDHYCFSYCPNGTIPGLYPDSTGDCTFP